VGWPSRQRGRLLTYGEWLQCETSRVSSRRAGPAPRDRQGTSRFAANGRQTSSAQQATLPVGHPHPGRSVSLCDAADAPEVVPAATALDIVRPDPLSWYRPSRRSTSSACGRTRIGRGHCDARHTEDGGQGGVTIDAHKPLTSATIALWAAAGRPMTGRPAPSLSALKRSSPLSGGPPSPAFRTSFPSCTSFPSRTSCRSSPSFPCRRWRSVR
jgi:hypothetical protein